MHSIRRIDWNNNLVCPLPIPRIS